MTFPGKVVVVTGASSGIGRALCLELAPQRPKLVLAARDLCRRLFAPGLIDRVAARAIRDRR
jgi:NAD(P)-dependent dehydrogenase (short-subunit alcohol dehydrogenase family)